jgi:hypothetical protein
MGCNANFLSVFERIIVIAIQNHALKCAGLSALITAATVLSLSDLTDRIAALIAEYLHPGAVQSTMIGGGCPCDCESALFRMNPNATIRKIASAMGEKLCQMPILPWQDRFNDPRTGAIKNMMPEDLPHPIMRGVDPLFRPYIAIKTDDIVNDKKTTGVETFYQSLPSVPNVWESGHRYLYSYPIVKTWVDQKVIDDLRKIFDGGSTENYLLNHTKRLFRKEVF